MSSGTQGPRDRVLDLLSENLNLNLDRVIQTPSSSSNSPESLANLKTALHRYNASRFDSVLDKSRFTIQNQNELIACSVTCAPDFLHDAQTPSLVCDTTYEISLTNARAVGHEMRYRPLIMLAQKVKQVGRVQDHVSSNLGGNRLAGRQSE